MIKQAFNLGLKLAYAQELGWLPGKYKQKEKKIKEIDPLIKSPEWVAQPKIDGVGTGIILRSGERPRIFTAEVRKTGPREHTEKVTLLENTKTPPSLNDTVLRAELFARDKKTKKPIPARQIVGILNSKLDQSLKRQKELNAELVPALLTVEKYQGKDTRNLPFKKQLELMHKIRRKIPVFVIPDTAFSPHEKIRLLNLIKTKKHPLTQEGVVFHSLSKGKAKTRSTTIKSKFRPDFDVYVRRIFPGKGGRSGNAAGGFYYSWSPRGPIVGKVGTGFTHELVRDMFVNPQKYVGRVAKVKSAGPFPGSSPTEPGALRAPSFLEWHLEKGKQPTY